MIQDSESDGTSETESDAVTVLIDHENDETKQKILRHNDSMVGPSVE